MVREQGPFKLNNPWSRISWTSTAVVFVVCFVFGFVVLGRFQQNDPALGTWAAFCRAIGLTADSGPAVSLNRRVERRHELPGPKLRWRVSRPAASNRAPSSLSTVAPAMASGASVPPPSSPRSPA